MPLKLLQARLRELGRFRCGETRTSSNGKSYPAALDTFRITSAWREPIDRAAEMWGGKVTPWASPAGPQFQVTIEEPAITIVIPPTEFGFTQWMELWSGGGCQRRCDGEREFMGDTDCLCDPADRDCSPTTRCSFFVPDLPGFGLWRLESHGYNAAAELLGVFELVRSLGENGRYVEALLRLDHRSVKRPGPNGKPVTQRFVVPVCDLGLGPMELVVGATRPGLVEDRRSVEVEAHSHLSPVPAREVAAPSIRDQVAAVAGQQARPPKVDLPPSGVDPETGEVSEPEPPPPPEEAEPSGTAPPASHTDPEVAHRRVMAEARKTWPDVSPDQREGLRHALGVIATYTPRAVDGHPPVASTKQMTLEELIKMSTLMADIRHGQMTIERIEDSEGGDPRWVARLTANGRIAVVTSLGADEWDVVVHNRDEGPAG